MTMEKRNTMIRDLAEDDKPREKALTKGIDSLSDTELLAIIFGSGLRGKSVIEMSREILADQDYRLDFLAKKTIAELSSKYSGIGIAKATSLAASIELGRRCQRAIQENGEKDPTITQSEHIFNFIRDKVELLTHEEFYVLHISRAGKIVSTECISKGGTSSTLVDVKMVLKSAVDRLSTNIILVHNHPSGAIRPSGQDDALTHKIVEAAKLLDITVLDHIIVGHGKYFSYADEGRL